MELRTYLEILVRGWMLLAAAVLAGLVAAGAFVILQTPQYAATTQVVFAPQNAGDGQDLAYAGNYVQAKIQTYKGMATTASVLAPVVEELDLDASVTELAEQVEVEVSQIDTLVRVHVEDPDAEDAARLADAVAESLIAAVVAIENGDSEEPGAVRVVGQVVSPAVVPDDPASPRLTFALLAGLFGGLLVGAAALTLRHLFRPVAAS